MKGKPISAKLRSADGETVAAGGDGRHVAGQVLAHMDPMDQKFEIKGNAILNVTRVVAKDAEGNFPPAAAVHDPSFAQLAVAFIAVGRGDDFPGLRDRLPVGPED